MRGLGFKRGPNPSKENPPLNGSEKISVILSAGKDQRLYFPIKIGEWRSQGLNDSGATSSIIGRKGWEKLKDSLPELRYSGSIVKVADGRKHEVLGTVKLPVQFDSVLRELEFFVVPTLPHEVILGVDFCISFQVVVDVHSRTAYSKLKSEAQLNEAIVSQGDLEESQLNKLNELIARFKPTIGREGLGCTHLYEHKIDTGDTPPIRTRYYSYSPKMLKHLHEGLERNLALGVVEKSTSAWCSPVIILPKSNTGEYRWVVNLKRINEHAKPDAYAPQRVNDILDQLREANYLSSIDCKSAYWQIPLESSSREKTAFMVPGRGLYQFTRLPQGLNSSSAAWQRFIDGVIGYDLQPHCFVYLDDIILISATFEEHIELLEKVMSRLETANITINLDKCKFCRSELRYLGYIVDKEGLRVCPDKVRAVQEFNRPKSVKEVRRFVGLASWYRRFVPHFASVIAPITNLTKGTREKPIPFVWSPQCEEAFLKIKTFLTTAPILVCPNFEKEFFLHCDASETGLGVILSQELDGSEVVAYGSRRLSKAEELYTTTELECLCVVWAVERFRAYLEGSHFTVVTDHASLVWLHKLKDPRGRLGRWVVRLQQFSFSVVHRK